MVGRLPSIFSAGETSASPLFEDFSGTMRPSDFPWPYIAGVRPPAFPTRSTVPSVREEPRDIPVPVRGVSVHAEGLRPRWARVGLAITSRPVLPSAATYDVGVPETLISRLNTSPARAPVNASASSLRPTPHDSGSGWFATPFLHDSFIRNSAPITGASNGPPILWFLPDRRQLDLIVGFAVPVQRK